MVIVLPGIYRYLGVPEICPGKRSSSLYSDTNLRSWEKFEGKQAKAYMLNPMGFSIPLTKEMIPKLMKKFGLEGDQK